MWLLCWYSADGDGASSSWACRAAELRSLAAHAGVDPTRVHIASPQAQGEVGPSAEAAPAPPSWVALLAAGRSAEPALLPVHFDTDLASAVRIVGRSVLMHCCLEVWGAGGGMGDCAEATRQLREAQPLPEAVAAQSFRVRTAGIGCHLSKDEQRAAIEQLVPLSGMSGPVRMKGAECVLWYIADRWEALQQAHRQRLARAAADGGAEAPQGQDATAAAGAAAVFGRQLSLGCRELLPRLALSKRLYLGPTTMAPDKALLSANLAAVRPGHLVLDPCCGSGSLLLACALFGASVVGSDANRAAVSGGLNPRRNKGHSPSSNFAQCGLPPPLGWAVADLRSAPFVAQPTRRVFDAIVCDPPYGLRESERGGQASAAAEHAVGEGLFEALVELASAALVPGGRLVYWRPARAEQPEPEQRTASRCDLRPVHRCEFVMSRRLRGHGKRGKGRGQADEEHGGADYATDREAGRERRLCIVYEKVG